MAGSSRRHLPAPPRARWWQGLPLPAGSGDVWHRAGLVPVFTEKHVLSAVSQARSCHSSVTLNLAVLGRYNPFFSDGEPEACRGLTCLRHAVEPRLCHRGATYPGGRPSSRPWAGGSVTQQLSCPIPGNVRDLVTLTNGTYRHGGFHLKFAELVKGRQTAF